MKNFQRFVSGWANECFDGPIVKSKNERNHRFLEEALELVQACECTQAEAHQLVDYVFGRPVGEPHQEMGGVMVTLALLAHVQGLDIELDAYKELARILQPDVMEKIRQKQRAKPKIGALPQ